MQPCNGLYAFLPHTTVLATNFTYPSCYLPVLSPPATLHTQYYTTTTIPPTSLPCHLYAMWGREAWPGKQPACHTYLPPTTTTIPFLTFTHTYLHYYLYHHLPSYHHPTMPSLVIGSLDGRMGSGWDRWIGWRHLAMCIGEVGQAYAPAPHGPAMWGREDLL